MADPETETAIEEAILDGAVDSAYLRQIEEELIDDSLLGRLSEEERAHFNSDFLCTPERRRKLGFASAIKRYSEQQILPAQRSAVWTGLKRFATVPWSLALAGALVCALIATTWLTNRNIKLDRELAQNTREKDEAQRLITSMQEAQKQRENRSTAQQPPSASPVGASQHPAAGPIIRLSGGVTRGLTAVPVLVMGKHGGMVSVVLDLPFDLHGAIHEELLDSNDQSIWSQQFSAPVAEVRSGIATIVLPAELLSAGEYRLIVTMGAVGQQPATKITYLFRVRHE
jgi:hypothetical protein